MIRETVRAVREGLFSALRDDAVRLGCLRARGRHLLDRMRGRRSSEAADLLVVLPDAASGWILDAIGREIASRFPGKTVVGEKLDALPPARNVWFGHHSYVPEALAKNPHLWGARRVALFTHARALPWRLEEWIYALGHCHRVVTMNRGDLDRLVQWGVARERLVVGIPGIDPVAFQPPNAGEGQERGEAIGFCSAFYPRKAPDRILAIARAFPDRKCRLLGRGWETWERWSELEAQPNLEVLQLSYSDYPNFYRTLRVFVSPATLEGGPMPLLEALASGVPVAASRTGFAPDVVRAGIDGVLFERHASDEEVIEAVGRALTLPAISDPPARHLTWDRFASIVSEAWRLPTY